MRARAITVCLALLAAGLAPAVSRAQGATDVAGIPASLVGVHGPTQDYGVNLHVVGHADMTPPGGTKPLGNNGGIALIGDCAFVGRWHDYTNKAPIQIVNIADPSNPVVVGSIPEADMQGGVSREIRAIDLPNFKMLSVLVFNQGPPDRTHNDMVYFTFPSGDCTQPVLAGEYDMKALRGHEFFQWLDPNPAHDVAGHPRIIDYVTTPFGPVNVIALDASDPAAPSLIGLYQDVQPVASPTEKAGDGLGSYVHSISVSPDGTEVYISDWDGGYFTLDSTACTLGQPACALVPKGAMSAPLHYGIDPDTGLPSFGNTHSAVALPGTNDLVVGDEIYASTDGCPYGWMRIIDKGDAATPAHQIGEFRLPENHASACGAALDPNSPLSPSPLLADRNANGDPVDGTFTMHNQTVVQGAGGARYAIVSWYGGGLRVVDLTDPAHPQQTGMFVPQPLDAIKSTPQTTAPIYGADNATSSYGAGNDWWVSMWSYPIVRDGLIYVSDMRNGLYILAPDAGAPFADAVANTRFVEGNSNFGMFVH